MTNWDDIAGSGLPIESPPGDHDPDWKPVREPPQEVDSALCADNPRDQKNLSTRSLHRKGQEFWSDLDPRVGA